MDPNQLAHIERENEGKSFSMEALRINTKKIEVIQTIMFMLGGIIAGLLGLIGIHGVYMLLALSATTTIIFGIKMGFNIHLYTNISALMFPLISIKNNFSTFLLFWTLTYAIVFNY